MTRATSLTMELQPDQNPERWNDHVAVYEKVFEPLTNAFAVGALDHLGLAPGDRVIDVAAGAGGAALLAAGRGAEVVAIDGSPGMVQRIHERVGQTPGVAGRVRGEVMDGKALDLSDDCFDAAISVFGVILFPDADLGMREIARVLKPGGRAAIVAWTATERYELAVRLMAAVAEVRGPQPPPSSLPAQLRFRDEAALQRRLADAGVTVAAVTRMEERWRLPAARWIAVHIAFAPGMAAMVGALGADRIRVLDAFVAALEREEGRGEIALSAIDHIGIGRKAAPRTTGRHST